MNDSSPVVAAAPGSRRLAGAAQSRNYTSVLLIVVAALLVAAGLGLAHLTQNRFHPDEALYATFARDIASGPGRGLLLSHMLVDKPPLAFYLDGLSVALLGPSEFALRLPTLLASVVSVALVYAIGRRLYGRTAGAAATWAMALSPFAIQFSFTIFLDPLLTTWVLFGILFLVRQRPGWAALALALAWATKQTALLFFPVAFLLGVASLRGLTQARQGLSFFLRAALPTLAGVVLVTLLVIGWDMRRGAPISTYEQGYGDNIANRLARPDELRPRADALLGLLRAFTGNDVASSVLLGGLVLVLIVDLRERSQAAWADWLLALFILGYVVSYWVVSLNLFDRYFLPLVPLAALLAGRVLERAGRALAALTDWLSRHSSLSGAQAWRRVWSAARVALPLLALAAVVPLAAAATYDFSPIGGDHGAYDGIDDTARFIRTLPPNGILYDHWLTWEFDYYLFGSPITMVYYPDGAGLTHELLHRGRRGPHYLVVPWWAKDLDLAPAVTQAGYGMRLIHRALRRDGAVSITLYQLEPVNQ